MKNFMKLMENRNSISQEIVDDFIRNITSETHIAGEKRITVTHVVLKNGFVITESSSCVDDINYKKEIGEEINIENAKNKLWELLGFTLACYKSI